MTSAMMSWTGTMKTDNGKFGFIAQDDGGEDMFVMPAQCKEFGGVLPPIGTQVAYGIATDPKSGKPRAEEVQPLGLGAADAAGQCSGTFTHDRGKFGFITKDDGGAEMFVMPAQCAAFGGFFPPIGTRVVFTVVPDAKTGRPRAEDVQPEQSPAFSSSAPKGWRKGGARDGHAAAAWSAGPLLPAMKGKGKGKGKGPVVPLVAKSFEQLHGPANSWGWGPAPQNDWQTGTMHQDNGSFGFISQDSGAADMFVMPAQCQGNALPRIGSRVAYRVTLDPKTGRPRAEEVSPEKRPAPSRHGPARPPAMLQAGLGQKSSGTMVKDRGSFGFISQDAGGPDIFAMPAQCVGFGGALPPEGARVVYKTGFCPNAKKTIAEDVVAEGDGSMPPLAKSRRKKDPAEQTQEDMARERRLAEAEHLAGSLHLARDAFLLGTIAKHGGSFGFVTQDSGDPDLFVMPAQCIGFGGVLPAVGTRITYTLGTDPKKGRPVAENVSPEDIAEADLLALLGDSVAEDVAMLSGTMHTNNGKFGFIKQDSGEEDMFVMPAQCQAFGGTFPAKGTRVVYAVVADDKTGRPRAENVQPGGP